MKDTIGVRKHLRALGLALLGSLVSQPLLASDYVGVPQVSEFITGMTRDHGFASEQLTALFAQAERKQAILDAISRPAERVKPWSEYRPIFITEARINKGVAFWQQHAETLARAEQSYGVPAQVIVAIIGVETFYGGNTGSWRVLDALSTLCFDYPPRSPFFCQQLKEFLLLAREEQVDPLTLKGSYAGAMGLPQFMPSSTLRPSGRASSGTCSRPWSIEYRRTQSVIFASAARSAAICSRSMRVSSISGVCPGR